MKEFIAHIRENGDIQSVNEHCNETAVLCTLYAESLHMTSIAKIVGLLHDVGKYVPEFNEYILGDNKYHKGDIDHSYAGAKYICLFCDEMGSDYYDLSRFIARIIVSHHGLHDWVNFEGEGYLQKRISKDKNFQSVIDNLSEIISNDKLKSEIYHANDEYNILLTKLKELSKKAKNPHNALITYTFYRGLLERFMESILVDADRTNTAEFMLNKNIELNYNSDALFDKFSKNYNQYMKNKESEFQKQNTIIVNQRKDISNRCMKFANHPVGICQLIVPTGGGKTLSSLRFALEYCKQYKMKKIFYIAPFMSILEQNSDIFREIIGDDYFLEHHSNVLQELDDIEELEQYELFTQKWDKPVIATTMVQFLNTLFLGKLSSVRRFHCLSNSVIIIDEVQSIPIKCVNLFNLAINFLKEICECTIVLCSATQPDFTVSEYPLLLDEDSQMVGDYTLDFKVFHRTDIVPSLKLYQYTYDEAAIFCYDKYIENGNLLIVVNTKKSVSTMLELLTNTCLLNNDSVKIVALSTNQCPQHRRDILNDLNHCLQFNEPVICVTTPLIEAGVDISFKCVVRFLSGLDNIAQAAGRCNRNAELEIGSVYVINVKDEQLGSLSDIKLSQDISTRFLKKEDMDYLSVDTMKKYFSIIYNENRKKMSYCVDDNGINTTILELLSTNSKRCGKNSNKELKMNAQAFKTAGTLFKVIDSNTIDIVVPYNQESIEMIDKLESLYEFDDIIRKLQKYTVSIYLNQTAELDQYGALICYECGKNKIFVLKKDYYDKNLGVNIDNVQQELLIF